MVDNKIRRINPDLFYYVPILKVSQSPLHHARIRDNLWESTKRNPMPDTIKEFFTEAEWDLIYSLVDNNREFCEDTEEDPTEDYDSIVNKIHKLFEPESIEPS